MYCYEGRNSCNTSGNFNIIIKRIAEFQGDSIEVMHPGIHNANQGPDFTNAKIKINDTVWAGNVELH